MEMDFKKSLHNSPTAHKECRHMNDPFGLKEVNQILGRDTFPVVVRAKYP